MSTTTRVAAFAAGLAAVFAMAFGLGRAVGPVDTRSPAPHVEHESAGAPR